MTLTIQEQQRIETLEYSLEQLSGRVYQYSFLAGQGFTGANTLQSGYLQSSNFVQSSSGFKLTAEGIIYAVGAVISGSITATSGTIGGFTIGSDYIRDAADSFGMASTVTGGDDVRFWAGDTFANRATADFRVTEAGAVTASSMTITGGAITGTPIASIPNSTSTDISLLDLTHDIVFSVTDKDTIAWASGTITMSNGRTFSISSGNTGNMAARTYVYLDTGVSSTVLQTTTTVSTAMGANKKLIAVCQNQNAEASYTVYDGIGGIKLAASNTSISNNNWTYSGAFSVTDADTIAWASGTLTTSNGGSYSITGSNTGNMAAKTYVYFDLGTSSTAFQTTTTASTAIGDGKILIAVCKNGTNEANYMLMNDNSYNIDAANIVAGSITANEIAASTITAAKLSVSQLSAITADMGALTAGTVTLDTAGYVRGGQTAYNTGTGFFLGYESAAYKFSIGDATTNYLTWDGTTLVYTGATTSLGFFGDASDGDVTISGNTTLSADKNYRSLTVNTGVTLTTAGYKIYVAGLLTTTGTGSIVNNGGVGGNGTNGTSAPAGGTGGVAGTAGAGATMGAGKAGVAGQNGQTGSGNGNAGTAGLAANPAIGRSGGASGAGGDSNVGQTGGAAGAAGTATSENVTVKTTAFAQSANLTSGSEDVLTRKFSGVGATSGVDFTTGFGGAGGAGGAEGARSPDGGAATGGGGGGGGGGGIVFIAARKIINNGTISANGGNGGNAGSPNSGANARAGGSGGGGGGGGGSVILIYETLTNNGSIVASAGSGGSGSGGNGGGASGSSGSSGTAGTVYKVKIQ